MDQHSPLVVYQQAIDEGKVTSDRVQKKAIDALDVLWHQLVAEEKSSKTIFSFFRKKQIPQGVYMWGGVGRGKTWLMDLFFESLPLKRKMRLHFHHFMQYVHQQLNQRVGQQNPLDAVADHIHEQAKVICFDEFFVSSVPDAMILSDLFQKLFQRGVSLIATSNIAPDGLYKDGLHRDRFLPTIALLKKHCHILNIDAGIDYRLRILQQADLFQSPLNEKTTQWMQQRFNQLVDVHKVMTTAIEVNHREVLTLAHTSEILWCHFNELCLKPRSPIDFIEIANRYHTVFVSDIPLLSDQLADGTRRFIYLVDEFYDRGVKLILTSQVPILNIYQGQKLAFEIERTRSRLLEMQSAEYLSKKHRMA
ncbi:AFG1 family ATPase [Acinetobacter sp. B10A]|uniref:cell division protein ZapE n=1 Tax=Acinetobacter baretiae TaxID=2605383 RepID=UPI001B3C535B|nr:cell division protein ZapE [Acinetobacter baretiae]MBF7684535.1 AFG1 family ATPase [Acinetobacter baretiae]